MKTVFDQCDCQNLKHALAKEWLETNGLGGFASSTIIGANTRRQHGLLVASLRPPVERHVLLSKFEERVVMDGHESAISTNLYPGTVFPHGFNIQMGFRLRPWPVFRYANNDFEIEKSVFLVSGENTVVVGYRNQRSRHPIELKVRPLLAFRDYNALAKRDDDVDFDVERSNGVLSIQPYADKPRLYFHTKADAVDIKPDWYFKFTYPVEEERGLDFEEDLFTPFELSYRLGEGQTVYIVATIEKKNGVNAEDLAE
ncbi:MAG: glycogen debranching enzyme N-terminal domain-containing protein, partial [Verrucomicrobiia bacterium]